MPMEPPSGISERILAQDAQRAQLPHPEPGGAGLHPGGGAEGAAAAAGRARPAAAGGDSLVGAAHGEHGGFSSQQEAAGAGQREDVAGVSAAAGHGARDRGARGRGRPRLSRPARAVPGVASPWRHAGSARLPVVSVPAGEGAACRENSRGLAGFPSVGLSAAKGRCPSRAAIGGTRHSGGAGLPAGRVSIMARPVPPWLPSRSEIPVRTNLPAVLGRTRDSLRPGIQSSRP